MIDYTEHIAEIINSGKFLLSTEKPSDWNERNRIMTSDVSPWPGKFSYDKSPYLREIVDCLAPDHPARIIAVMKGAQIGFSTGVIEAGIGWIIAQNPGNILFLTGHSELSEEAMSQKIDQMIDSCGLRVLIKPSILKKKNSRTGDTTKRKEFPGGSLVAGGAGNHKLLRQRSVRYGFIDDFDAAKSSSKESGSTTKMIEQRFAAYYDKMKLAYISTPELKQNSNIEPVYLAGDQRKFHIPCPCCGEYIPLEWSCDLDGKENEKAGITWQLDSNNDLISESVGYICQKCGGFFTEANKFDLNLAGEWRPTAKPSEMGYYSYHLSSLYAPAGMYDWEHYVRQYIEAHPPGEKPREHLQKTFVNLCLGQTFEATGESPKANDLQKNIRNYEINLVPEKISIADGNGKIVLLTCACDLNGKLDDARLDYEIVAWSENKSTYSITHGSIGTFIPNESGKKNKQERERWSYEHHRANNVWKEFTEILSRVYMTDTGRKMKIFISGVDTGYCEKEAFEFIDKSNLYCVGLKGDKENKYIPFGANIPNFTPGRSRPNLYLLQVNQIKDDLADLISLKWDDGNDEQPSGFMNFPTPAEGKYLFKNFFSHFESEFRDIESKDGESVAARWKKKNAIVQNHHWDVRIYNMALTDILLGNVFKELKIKSGTWKDYCDMVLGKTKL